MRPKLHKPHVARLGQFSDAFDAGEELEHRLNGHNGVAVGQRVFFRRIGQLLIHHNDVLRQRNPGPQQIIQAANHVNTVKTVISGVAKSGLPID